MNQTQAEILIDILHVLIGKAVGKRLGPKTEEHLEASMSDFIHHTIGHAEIPKGKTAESKDAKDDKADKAKDSK